MANLQISFIPVKDCVGHSCQIANPSPIVAEQFNLLGINE